MHNETQEAQYCTIFQALLFSKNKPIRYGDSVPCHRWPKERVREAVRDMVAHRDAPSRF